ncbi:toprim domain-containing protein [Roseomonas xinghualingensis]|uniref:toprim domain-containing protein n=1 Tax=Roseomonas xinghualingensis TaxID=2986475 RepID=UPI0021F1843C|nr:bifunctional DNA primase/helicase [Roseomonas sp. SXEYE001]MCV4209363.1 toprim domain-containing protein [Roseomonas sp. SXEYE001]
MNHPDNLPELLAEHGIHLKSYAAGREERLCCPRCLGGSSREDCLAVRVDDEGDGATWICHRGKCGWRHGVTLRQPERDEWRRSARRPVEPEAPVPHRAEEQRRPEGMYAWFESRRISRETVDLFGCYVTTKGFRQPGGAWQDKDAIVFPYVFQGRLVNRKYRSPEKELMQDKSPLPTLFNIDAVVGDDVLIWVEGEPDVMAVHEAGYPQVVSLKDGASKTLRAEDDPRRQDQKRFAAMATHDEKLNSIKKHILAGDMDEPGKALREEMARRIGRHRCWIVTWPEGCKDAGDTLRDHGPDAVAACIEAAKPYPIQGVMRIKPGDLVALRNQGRPPVLSTGTENTDRILSLPGEGRIIIVTGIPNHGKSSWVMFVKAHLMLHHQRRFATFSPEMEPWADYVAAMAAVLSGKPFWPTPGHEAMTDEELARAETYLEGRLAMLVSDPEREGDEPTLDWILERARIEVMRSGVTDLDIDPWNELDHSRPAGVTETDHIGRSLQRLRAFARRHGVNVWIVAHPAKPFPTKRGEKPEPPNLYSISGSANWNNKADLGLTVHTEDGVTQIHITKSRFQRWGRRGDVAHLEFERATGIYSDATVPLPGEDE